MNWRRWLRRGKPDEPAGTTETPVDPLEMVRWLPAAQNPFGVDVLDCSVFAGTMVAMTSNADVAKRFTELRESDGHHCRDQDPNALTMACHLEYPSDSHTEGPIFKAAQMEDKWDVFLLESNLYFARSWTGDVAYRVPVIFRNGLAIVREIHGDREPGASEDPLGTVDYLMKSHVYGLVAPHPLPQIDRTNTRDLALWSFGRYGRRGVCGTMADVTHLAVRREQDGRCILARPV